jgi:hypothetical protein
MTTALYDSVTENILFIRAGTPDTTTHALWRAGAINIYRPGDWPNILVTIDPHGVCTEWEFTDTLPATCQLPPSYQWIPYGEVTYGSLTTTELVAFDTWRRNAYTSDTGAHPAHWEEYARPVLVRPPPPELTLPPAPSASSRHDLAAASDLPPSAPPASPPRPPRPQPVTNTPSFLPPHIQRIVIDAAIAAGATCPITMEPITADTAVITPCGHVFGTDLTRVSLCPVCRSTL